MPLVPPRLLPLACVALAAAAAPASAYDEPYKLLGVRWPAEDGPVEFTVHEDGSDDIEGDEDLEAVRRAFRKWACIEGSILRFREVEAQVAKAVDLDDGVNLVFWDETGEYGMGPATLGITVGNTGDPSSPARRDGADIVFNGFHSAWSAGDPITGVDVESIAVHEIGHLLGLDHPCDLVSGQEQNCNGPERSVMTPAWSGGDARTPLPDDAEGVLALYAPEEGEAGTCEGPFQKGERCEDNCACVEGLRCVPGVDGAAVCAPSCSSKDADCGTGFACVLSSKQGDEAPGTCLRLPAGARKPLAATCGGDGECESGLCLAVPSLGRSVCKKSCDADDECGQGYLCNDGACVSASAGDGIPCPGEDDEPGCGCASSASDVDADDVGASAGLAAGLLALVGFARLARRRRA